MEAPAAALDLGEVARRLANVVRAGTVAETDLGEARARVQYGEGPDGPVLTGWLPWIAHAGEDRAWRPPSVGEQVVLLAPYGELSAAWILPGAYRDEFPAPESSGAKSATAYRDGAIVCYDAEAHELSATLPDGGTASITAPGGLAVTGDTEIDGDVEIDGDLEVTGEISATKDISAGKNISADGDVTAGKNVSDRLGSMQQMRTTFNLHTHGVPPGVVVPPPNQRMT